MEHRPSFAVTYWTGRTTVQIGGLHLDWQTPQKNGRYKTVGATLLRRMAVTTEFQNQKLGRFILFAAVYEGRTATSHVGSVAVVVNAKTEIVVSSYEKYGFRRLAANRLRLPMKTIEHLTDARNPDTTARPPA